MPSRPRCQAPHSLPRLLPPRWLLTETAEMWEHGIDEGREAWDALGNMALRMEKAEAEMTESSPLPAPLSTYIIYTRELGDGKIFLSYAARKRWAFDAVYWRFLNEGFFWPARKRCSKE